MTWDSLRAEFGRRPFHIIEIDFNRCQLTYGVAPCAAVLGVTGADRCYNTRKTCQSPDTFDPALTTLRFCTPTPDQPRNLTLLPYVRAVDSSPTKIDPNGSLGRRAALSVTMMDAPHHDRGIDPYAGLRAYDAMRQGTFWGKFQARFHYYLGRPLRWKSGYLDDSGVLDEANFQTRYFVIENISGPDASGQVRIEAKDPLKLADDDRAQAPFPNTGRLAGDITATDTSATLAESGVGDAEYSSTGKVRIGKEVLAFTRIGDALTFELPPS